jgi:hypothetical protein
MRTDSAASDIVTAILDASAIGAPPTLLELALVLEVELRARRGAPLELELEPKPRLTFDSASPRQDALLAFGLARYLASLGMEAAVRALAAALQRACVIECRTVSG